MSDTLLYFDKKEGQINTQIFAFIILVRKLVQLSDPNVITLLVFRYDERKSQCGLPVQTIGLSTVITVLAAICCAILACGHLLVKSLPRVAKSFFIFNANEDNRLYVDPMIVPPDMPNRDKIVKRKYSTIPVSIYLLLL